MKQWNFERFLPYFKISFWTNFFNSYHPLTLPSVQLAKPIRILAASIRGYINDDCSSKASALTFYSLLSIVPVLAVAFGVAKGFGFQKHFEEEVMYKLSDQQEIASKIIVFAQNMLDNAQGGLIAGVGLIVLLWSVLQLLSNIESSFNAIWKVKTLRSWSRRLSDYLAMMFLCPIFFAVSSSISVFVTTNIIRFSQENGLWEKVSPFLLLAFHLFPLVLGWLLFTAIYYILPNTKVPLSCALVAGIAVGTAYQIVQWIYIQFQVGLASYGAIYGSFAALPLFLIWLNTSWLIILAGAEFAYHTENDRALLTLSRSPRQLQADTRIVGLLITQECVQAFCKGDTPPTVYDLAQHTGIAVVAARHLLYQLVNAGILVEVNWRDGTIGHYQPARDLTHITFKAVCDALDSARQDRYWIVYTDEAEQFEKDLNAFDILLEKAAINYSLAHNTLSLAQNR